MVLKSSFKNASKIKSEPKCDKEIPKKLAEIWQNFQEKMGILLQNNPLNFIFGILAKCRTKKTLLSRIAMNPQKKLRNKKENNK